MNSLRHGLALIAANMLDWVAHPRLRACLLRILGARVGRNVRVYRVSFMNLEQGFRNLWLDDDVHIGTDVLFDLKGTVHVCRGGTLSPRVIVLTHIDPGSAHGSPLCFEFPPSVAPVSIGPYAWIGTASTILPGSKVNERCVVGAASLVRGELEADSIYVGVPARKLRKLRLSAAITPEPRDGAPS